MPKQGQKTITVSESLWNKLKELADEENRSIPKQIEYILGRYMGSKVKIPEEKDSERLKKKSADD